MKKNYQLISLLILLFLSTASQGKKDYRNYHIKIIQIEELIAEENFSEALQHYKSLFDSYDFVFARDAYNACQIACLTNNPKASFFLKRCAQSGVPKNTLLNNPYIAILWDSASSYFDSLYTKERSRYISRINQALRNEFITRYQQEQAHKGLPDYKEICYDNFNRILQLAQKDQFPGEQQIGVNDELENGFVFATLKHYPYSYRILYQYIEKGISEGTILPIAALYVYGFNQTRTSILNTNMVPTDTVNFKVCYNIAFGKQSADIKAVNKQRKLKYVASTDVHQKLEQMIIKYKLDFKLGY